MAIQFTYPRKNNPDSSDLLLIADSQNYWRTRQITIEDIAAAVIPGGYTLPTASTVVLGGVRIDGNTINIDNNGVISVSSSVGLQNLQDVTDEGNSTTNNIVMLLGGSSPAADTTYSNTVLDAENHYYLTVDQVSNANNASLINNTYYNNTNTSSNTYGFINRTENYSDNATNSLVGIYNLVKDTTGIVGDGTGSTDIIHLQRNEIDYSSKGNTSQLYGTINEMNLQGSSSNTISILAGNYNQIESVENANVTISDLRGSHQDFILSTGTATKISGERINVMLSGTVNVGSANLLELNYSNSSSGTVGNVYSIYSASDIPSYFRGDIEMGDGVYEATITNEGLQTANISLNLPSLDGTIARVEDIGLKIVDEGNGPAYSLSQNDRSKNLPAGLQTVDLAIYEYTGFAKSISLTNPGNYPGVSDGTYTAGVLSQTGSALPTNGATYAPIVEIVVVGGVITDVLLTGVEWAGFQVGDVVTLDLSTPTIITDATITIDAITNAGPESLGTFSSVGDNISYAQASTYGGHSMVGYGNTAVGYYGNHAIGTYNKVLNGYAFTSLGYSNWANMIGRVGIGGTMGAYNRNTESANITLGFGLTARAKGVVVVGTGNAPYTGSLTASDRPMFTVGIGDIDTTSTLRNGTVSNRANGFTVLRNGSVIADTLSKQGINLESNGRVLVTREWIEQTITREVPFLITASPGGSSSYSNSNNTIYLSWTGGSGVYDLTLPSASDIPYRTIQIISDGTLSANDKVHVLAPVGESIDGSLNPGFYALNKPYNGVKVWSDGSNWVVTQAKAT